jgi:sulfide:quinone oxidoreductase
VNPMTLETRFPDVYAVGDRTSVGTPKAGVFAEGQAAVVASQICARQPGSAARRPMTAVGSATWSAVTSRWPKVDVTFVTGQTPTGTQDGPSVELAAAKTAFGSQRVQRWFNRTWKPLHT